jgi:hypothetical protein
VQINATRSRAEELIHAAGTVRKTVVRAASAPPMVVTASACPPGVPIFVSMTILCRPAGFSSVRT